MQIQIMTIPDDNLELVIVRDEAGGEIKRFLQSRQSREWYIRAVLGSHPGASICIA